MTKSKSEFNRQYKAYLKQYNKAKKKWGVAGFAPRYTKKEYASQRLAAVSKGFYHPNVELTRPKGLFGEYLQRYEEERKVSGKNLRSVLSMKNFKASLSEYILEGYKDPIGAMLRDSRYSNERQAEAMAENLRNNLEKWRSMPEGELSYVQRELLKATKGHDIDSGLFLNRNERWKNRVINILDGETSWDFAVGS